MERPAMAFNTLIPRAANLPQVGASAVRAAVSAPSFSSLRNCSVRGPCGLCRPDVPMLKGRAAATACGQSSRRARRNCAGVCMQTSPTRANGSGKPSPGSSTITRCRPTVAPSRPSARPRLWRRTLKRRGQKDRTTWKRVMKLADDWLPKPRILHPWPTQRLITKHPRWEPYAGKSHVPFCAGGARSNTRLYRDPYSQLSGFHPSDRS